MRRALMGLAILAIVVSCTGTIEQSVETARSAEPSPTAASTASNGDATPLTPGKVATASPAATSTSAVTLATATALPPVPSPVGTPGSSRVAQVSWGSCEFAVLPGTPVECGKLSVPEERDADYGRTITLNFAIFHGSQRAQKPDPVLFLAGGPGQAGVETVIMAFGQGFATVPGGRDLILLDQRGTGRSDPALNCKEIEEADLVPSESYVAPDARLASSIDAARRCIEELGRGGVRLSAFNSTQIAADADDLRRALRIDSWNVWGVSSGTRVALTMARDYPNSIRSLILDSTLPIEADLYLALAENAERAIKELWRQCGASPVCSEHYPDLEATFWALADRLNVEPVTLKVTKLTGGQPQTVHLDGVMLTQFLVSALYSDQVIKALPELIHSGSNGDFEALQFALSALSQMHGQIATGMHMAAQCNDEVAFVTQQEIDESIASVYPQLNNAIRTSLLGGSRTHELCEVMEPLNAPDSENQELESDIPALVLAGRLDPITPPEWGQSVAERFRNSHFIEFPALAHSVSLTFDQCPKALSATFLDSPDTSPAAACPIDLAAPVRFNPPLGETKLVPFTHDTFHLEGVAPEGWDQRLPGVWTRPGLSEAAIVQIGGPGSAEPALRGFYTTLGVSERPEPQQRREVGGVTWTVHRTVSAKGLTMTAATAEPPVSRGNAVVIVMIALPGERELMDDLVFRPAMEALRMTGAEAAILAPGNAFP